MARIRNVSPHSVDSGTGNARLLFMPFSRNSKALYVIIAAAILLRLLLVAYLYAGHNADFFVLGDSNGYLRLAHNIASGNGFSQESAPPYLPDSERVPLYPAVLAASLYFFNSYIPVLLLQIFLGGFLIWLAYRIARIVAKSETLALWAAALMAFEPYSIFINTSVLTETLFATFLLLGVYFGCVYIKGGSWRDLFLNSLCFGIATLVRPIGEFLFMVPIVLLLLRMPRGQWLKYLVAGLVPFFLIAGPWFLRNEATFGVFAISSGGLQNAYSDLGGAIISVRDHVSSSAAKDTLEAEYEARNHIGVADFQRDLSKSPGMFKEALVIMAENPVPTLKTLSSIAITFFTNDAWVYYLQRWQILPNYGSLAFSPSYTLMTEGPVATFEKVIAAGGATLPFAIVGRLFWSAVSALAFVGVATLIARGGDARKYGIFFATMVLYLLALSSSVGFGINGRFRYPVDALFFITAAIGAAIVWNWARRKRAPSFV